MLLFIIQKIDEYFKSSDIIDLIFTYMFHTK